MVERDKKTFLIVGAGHQGLAMAAHFSLNGERVYLWNRTEANIEEVCKSHTIICEGVIEGVAHIAQVSTDLKSLITDSIFVATPSSAHRDIAKRLAGIIQPETVVYLNPGRTFGAIDFLNTLIENGCKHIPVIVETQSILYTCRRMSANCSHIYALKKNVELSYIGKCDRKNILRHMPACIRDRFTFVPSVLDTSLGNIGMILHCAPVLLNTGWIESKKHAFYYYYDGISPSVGNILEKMDNERVKVAERVGIKPFRLTEWFEKTYGIEGDSIYECIQKNDYYKEIDAPKSLKHRYLQEDIPNGLVPVEYLGKSLGVDVSTISLIIDLAQAVCDVDYRAEGRKYMLDDLKKYISL